MDAVHVVATRARRASISEARPMGFSVEVPCDVKPEKKWHVVAPTPNAMHCPFRKPYPSPYGWCCESPIVPLVIIPQSLEPGATHFVPPAIGPSLMFQADIESVDEVGEGSEAGFGR